MAVKNWIKGAIRNPGAFTAKAKKAGAVTKKGTIEKDFINEMAQRKGKTGAQARLAKTLSKMRKG